MKKQFLVIDLEDPTYSYVVDDLGVFISETYEAEIDNGETLETVTTYFLGNYRAFEIEAIENEVSIKEVS
jgi:hypothetical protein